MIENELKFVLSQEAAEASNIEAHPDFLPSFIKKTIIQGYHSGGGRLRYEQIRHALPKYTFNYKMNLPDGQIEEFEQEIDQGTFDRCFPLCKHQVSKYRYTSVSEDRSEVWDTDFFYDPSSLEVYFVMAECEMPEGRLAPLVIPPFIEQFRLHDVTRGDNAFTSRKLGDIKYARTLFGDINGYMGATAG